MNQNNKRKFKFNFFDLLIVLILLGAAAILGYIFLSDSTKIGSEKTADIEYKILITGIRDEFKDRVDIGDKVTDSVKLMPIGEVIDVKYEQTVNAVNDAKTGEIVYVQYPNHLDMTVTIKAKATIEGTFYMIGGYHISVGTLVSMRVPDFTEQGYCTIINEVGE